MELDRNEVDVHQIFHVDDESLEEFENQGDGLAPQHYTTEGKGDVSYVVSCEDDHAQGTECGIFVDNMQLQTTPKRKEHSTEATVSTPAVGMTYETWEEIDLHFRCYARQNGFAVCRTSSEVRQRGGVLTKEKRNVIWKCEMWGKNKSDSNQVAITVPPVNVPNTRSRAAKNKNAENESNGNVLQKRQSSVGYGGVRVAEGKSKKCNCPVMLYAKASVDDKVWTIQTAVLKHEGHDLSPSKVKFIPTYRQEEWNPAIRRRLFNDIESGIKIPQIHRGLARERGGIENFSLTQRDMRNEVTKYRNVQMQDGDANAMYAYLRRMTEDNDQFYYEYCVDEIERLKDVMWVDARSKAAYEYFGDVVCFDTTYITNEFELPFANFVGVNHHGQTILLGCALLAHEDTETFEWLFSTWLQCMGQKAPLGILTDQDAAMKKALATSMPESRHRWCLWHILQKFYVKLGKYQFYETFSELLQNVIYDSLTPEEFEASWTSVVTQFGIDSDDWLQGLFVKREIWVPAYMRHMFWAGMRTTQRCESINSFFDNYVKRKTRLYEFVPQYVNAMESRVSAEKAADADCARYTPHTVTNFPFEKRFRKLYTNGKFNEVQIECMKTIYVRPIKIDAIADNWVEIMLTDRVYVFNKKNRKEYATEERRHYKVRFNTAMKEANCVCKMFDCNGILCRHVIAVYDSYEVADNPEKYILDRWRKDLKRKHTQVKVAYYDPSKTEAVKRYDRLNDASSADEDVDIVLEMIRKAKVLIDERRAKCKSSGLGDNIQGLESSVGNAVEVNGYSIDHPNHALRIPLNCSVDDQTQSDTHTHGASSQSIPNIKDPPTKKKPPYRPWEKRYLSCMEKPPNNPRKRGKGTKASNSTSSDAQPCPQVPIVPLPSSVPTNGFVNQAQIIPRQPTPTFQPIHPPTYAYQPGMEFSYEPRSYTQQGVPMYEAARNPPHQYHSVVPSRPFTKVRSVGGIRFGHSDHLGYVTRSYGPYIQRPQWFPNDCPPHSSSSSAHHFVSDTNDRPCGSTT